MPRTVVIVDDHAPFRASARKLLEVEGYEVIGEAADAASASRRSSGSGPMSCCSTSSSRR